MAGGILDAEELAAVRGAIGRAVASATTAQVSHQREATPVALIADDAAGERACPDGLKLATRGATLARQRLLRGAQIKLDLTVTVADVVRGALLRDEVPSAFSRVLEIEGRDGNALVMISGPMIESVAAKLLGGGEEENPNLDREPSAAALRVFSRAGDLIVKALADAWRSEQSATVKIVEDPDRAQTLCRLVLDTEILVAVTIAVSGNTSGQIRLIAPPSALAAPPPPEKLSYASKEALEAALGNVPVEIKVELGRTRMTATELSRLTKGALIVLHQAIDDLLPIDCAGVIKAYGRPVVQKGAMAVEVVAPVISARSPSIANQQAKVPEPTAEVALAAGSKA